eukprot:TRINITY_DN3562_c0_g1_i1.p1 TRINITY_DN3562_c0_g1~~TRINITY_DN3562_c0_g1_i1.p1  ORF type:complete len:179 (+),score=29.00 TRINITY_DN3562_c0_g1_i1:76-612(+)
MMAPLALRTCILPGIPFHGLVVRNTFIDVSHEDDGDVLELSCSKSAPALLEDLEQASIPPAERMQAGAGVSPEHSDSICTPVCAMEQASLRQSSEMPSLLVTSSKEMKRLEHENGTCKPCSYFLAKADGCRLGDQCSFCHLCSLDEVKAYKRDQKKNFTKKRYNTERTLAKQTGWNQL